MCSPRHMMRHMAMMPKGFLRHEVLKLLSDKPMSGSEIMTEIENQTSGHWRPSPGSIYPLLSWLEDKGYVKQTDGEQGIKRYSIMEQGKTYLEELTKAQEQLRERVRHFRHGPRFMAPPWMEIHPEQNAETREALHKLAASIFRLNAKLGTQYSDEAAEEARKALEEAAKKIDEIVERKS